MFNAIQACRVPVLVIVGGGGLVDGLRGGLRGPGDTLHHVVVVTQLTSNTGKKE